jgi:hypothetical protein
MPVFSPLTHGSDMFMIGIVLDALSTFSETVIRSSISMSRFTRLGGDFSAATDVRLSKLMRERSLSLFSATHVG